MESEGGLGQEQVWGSVLVFGNVCVTGEARRRRRHLLSGCSGCPGVPQHPTGS